MYPQCVMHGTFGHQSYLLFAEKAGLQIDLWDSPYLHPLPWVTVSPRQLPLLEKSCISVKAGGNAQSPTQEFPEITGEQLVYCEARRDHGFY